MPAASLLRPRPLRAARLPEGEWLGNPAQNRSLECHPLTFISMGGPQGQGDSLQSRLRHAARADSLTASGPETGRATPDSRLQPTDCTGLVSNLQPSRAAPHPIETKGIAQAAPACRAAFTLPKPIGRYNGPEASSPCERANCGPSPSAYSHWLRIPFIRSRKTGGLTSVTIYNFTG
jgi:hypothetical protein